MSNVRTYMIAAAGLAAFFIARALQAWRDIRYKFDNVTFAGGNINEVYLTLDFVLYNPTSISLANGDLDLDVYLENRKVGEIHHLANKMLEGKTITSFPLGVTINTADTIDQAWTLLGTSTVQQWTITLQGELQVAGHRLPIRYDYNLSQLKQ